MKNLPKWNWLMRKRCFDVIRWWKGGERDSLMLQCNEEILQWLGEGGVKFSFFEIFLENEEGWREKGYGTSYERKTFRDASPNHQHAFE